MTGRPTKYKPEYDELAFNYSLLGADDKQMAEFFGVTEQTLNNWKKSQPSFFESLKAGKADADANVGKSLYSRALGYTHKEEKVFCSNGEITTHTVDKHYPPDPTSMIFWLKNRQPKLWRDKPVEQEQAEQQIQKVQIEVVSGSKDNSD